MKMNNELQEALYAYHAVVNTYFFNKFHKYVRTVYKLNNYMSSLRIVMDIGIEVFLIDSRGKFEI